MTNEQKIADILRKYLLPDCLKPEYDGMTSYELAKKIMEVVNNEAPINPIQ